MNATNLINNPETGLIADLSKLQKMLKEKGIELDLKAIKKIRDQQEWYQLTQEKKRPKKFNSIYVPFPRDLYFMDVMVYDRLKINNYRYILNVIDTNSRYAQSRALTNMVLKMGSDKSYTLLDAIKDIFDEMGYPKELRCDNQFISKDFVNLMKRHNVNVVYSDPEDVVKNSLVERFNRTLADILQKMRIQSKQTYEYVGEPLFHWYKHLNVAVDKYNNNFHSGIKQKPIDVWNGTMVNNQKITRVEPNLKVGDTVRTSSKKKIFDKGDALKTSKAFIQSLRKLENDINSKISQLETILNAFTRILN